MTLSPAWLDELRARTTLSAVIAPSVKLIRAGRANIFKSDPELPDSAVTTDSMVDQLVIAGTPNQVVEELLAFREEIGDFGTLLYCGMDWVEPALARRSMELMAEEVMPAVNRAIGVADVPAAR